MHYLPIKIGVFMSRLNQQIILITGASSGIGRATAKACAQQGAHLILVARRLDKLNELITDIQTTNPNTQCLALSLDITNEKAVNSSLSQLPEKWQQIDILINNAGLAAGRDKFQDADMNDIEIMINTNLKGLIYVTKAVLPSMIKRDHGHIVNLGSVAGHVAYSGGSIYCATKSAVRSISSALRQDLFARQIRVTEIDPGLVATDFSLVRFKGDTEMAKKTYEGMTPLSPDDIADTIVYCITRPSHVNISEIVMYPTDQASVQLIHRQL
jgi:3-hydroxy acid dehydrogenase / malonic semialdehyde reductase